MLPGMLALGIRSPVSKTLHILQAITPLLPKHVQSRMTPGNDRDICAALACTA
jgi:hypothetical protein